MKIIITEEQLKELFKSTYNSAAAESVEQGDDELALDFLHHSNEMGIPELNGVYPPDVDNDGDTDADDDELSVDRFDIRQRIQSELNTMINEAGGYDDMGIMAVHGSATQSVLKTVIDEITAILVATTQAFADDMKKEDIMGGVHMVSNTLSNIKDILKRIGPELINDDLRAAAKDLGRVISRSEKKLRLLANRTVGSANPDMPPAMTGMGFAMSDSDFNDYFTKIIMDVSNSTERLAFQVRDELKDLNRRFRGESPDDYGYN